MQYVSDFPEMVVQEMYWKKSQNMPGFFCPKILPLRILPPLPPEKKGALSLRSNGKTSVSSVVNLKSHDFDEP